MKKLAKIFAIVMALALAVSIVAMPASAVTVTGVSGVEVTVDSNGSISESSGKVTATVTGSFTTRKTTTITVKNTSGSTATISFDYSVSKHDSSVSTIDDLCGANSGTYSVLLTANATKTFTMCSNRFTSGSNLTATAILSNFKVEAAAENSNVTVTYGSLGSVKLDGTAIASGSVNSVSSANGGSFVAVPGSGSKFVAWIDPATNAVVSTSATYQLIPTEAVSIRAVFTNASSAPVFYADGTGKLFESLDAALTYAASASNKTITLASDATLAAGDYTIPAGVTVNIPYNAANTLCTNKPTSHDNAYTAPSVFRTLNMAEGANLTVNGKLALSAAQSSKYGNNGMPSGPLPFIKMAANSKITVENGGNLYVWGYITGSGSVEVKSGGTAYECFQITDYRGGDATTQIVNKDDEYGVFPFNQYYLQSVEVPMTIHAGATEYGFTAITVTLAGTQTSDVPFIAPENAMFEISSGYIVKDYIEGTGRTNVEIYGDINVATVEMDMKVSLIGSLSINSSKYALPIPQHFTVSVESGEINMDQSVSFLPGSELVIKEGAVCNLGAGKKIIVYDLDQWLYNDGANGYSGTTNRPYMQLKYVPGGDGTTGRLKDAMIQVEGTVNATQGYVYTTAGGANIFSTGTGVLNVGTAGTETTTRQVITNDTSVSSWPEIAITPAVIKDGDGANVSTATAGTYTYYASTGKWCVPGHRYEAVVTAPTCTEKGYTTHTCIACGDSYTDSETAALGHKYESVVTAPTCENGGYTTHTCKTCNHSYTDSETEALGHDAVLVPGKAADCTNTGLTDGWFCNRCQTNVEEQQEIPALGHNEVIDEAVAATCENPGLTEGKHCDRCGTVIVEQTEVKALGHSYKEVTTDPTCTTAGKTVYTCSNCNHSYEKEIAALGHKEVVDAAVAATCTTTGKTEGKHCSVCGTVTVAQNVVDALGHSYSGWNVTAEPTYTTAGSQSKTCATCGDVVTEEIPVLANPVTAYNVVLDDNVGLNFVLNVAADAEIGVTVNGAAVDFAFVDGKISIELAAAQMTDIIAITVNGMPLANTYSVRGYADYILSKAEYASSHELVKAMLAYGAAAQTAFTYNTGNMADAGIEVTKAEVPTEAVSVQYQGAVSGVNFYGASLVYRDKVAVRFYFTGSSAGIEGAVQKGDMFYIEVADINPQELGNTIELTISNGAESLTVGYSPVAYIVRMYNKADTNANTKALAQALYGYYLAAVAYAG